MVNRKMKSQEYLRNFTLKNLLSCTTQLGKLYEDFINRITIKIKTGQATTIEDLRLDFAGLSRDKLTVAEKCYIQGGYEDFTV